MEVAAVQNSLAHMSMPHNHNTLFDGLQPVKSARKPLAPSPGMLFTISALSRQKYLLWFSSRTSRGMVSMSKLPMPQTCSASFSIMPRLPGNCNVKAVGGLSEREPLLNLSCLC